MNRIPRLALLLAVALLGVTSLAAAQDTLASARQLYGSAAYDEALTVLDRIKAADLGRDVALQEAGVTVDKKSIVLAEPIKAIGEYSVTVKAGYQTTGTIQVQVVPETVGDVQ